MKIVMILFFLIIDQGHSFDTHHLQKSLDKHLFSPTSQCSDRDEVCRLFHYFQKEGVPEKPLRQALFYYTKNKQKFPNPRYMSIADYSQSSVNKRFYLLDIEQGSLKSYQVSHGSGFSQGVAHGDPQHDGFLKTCSHRGSRTNMTRAGFFKTAETYFSPGANNSHVEVRNSSNVLIKGWPYISRNPDKNAMRLDGLTIGVNDHARAQGVVMHGAWYNEKLVTNRDIMGRSYGCPAFPPNDTQEIIDKIKNGSLYYAYVPQCSDDMTLIERDLDGFDQFCR